MTTETPSDSPESQFAAHHESMPSPMLRLLGACVATVLTHFMMVFFFSVFHDSTNPVAQSVYYFADAVIHRGAIQYFQLLAFWVAGITLLFIARNRRRESAYYHETMTFWFSLKSEQESAGSEHSIQEMTRKSKELPAHLATSKTGRRLQRAIKRLGSAKSSQEMEQFLNDLREIDEAAADEAHATVKFLSWLIPTCGFLGTVFGLSKGLMGFGNLVHVAANFSEVQAKIPDVCAELAVSFDTTYLSLVLTMVVSYLVSASGSGDGEYLSAIDQFCLTAFVYEFEWASKGESPQSSMGAAMGAILKGLNDGQRATGDLMMKSLLPVLDFLKGGVKIDLAPIQDTLNSQAFMMNSAVSAFKLLDQRLQKVEGHLKDGLDGVAKGLAKLPALMSSMNQVGTEVTLSQETMDSIKSAIVECPRPDLNSVENALQLIVGHTKEATDAVTHSYKMLDRRLFHTSVSVIRELKETSRDSQFKSLIEEFKTLTEQGCQRLESVTEGARQSATQLAEVSTKLEQYVREGGVADVAKFNQSVNVLSAQTAGFSTAAAQFHAAAAQLQSLSRLNEMAADLIQGAKMIQEGSLNTLEGARSFKVSGSELGAVLAKNDASQIESARVLADASDNIEQLVGILSHTSGAVSNLESAIQGIARRLERPRESDHVPKKG